MSPEEIEMCADALEGSSYEHIKGSLEEIVRDVGVSERARLFVLLARAMRPDGTLRFKKVVEIIGDAAMYKGFELVREGKL